MTNREKYKEEILDIFINDISRIAVDKRSKKPVTCRNMDCSLCLFEKSFDCFKNMKDWCNSEYEEIPTIDWSKVEVDTPILVMDSEDIEWKRAYFAKYEKGVVYTWLVCGCTSWTHVGITNWRYAKLAESEE